MPVDTLLPFGAVVAINLGAYGLRLARRHALGERLAIRRVPLSRISDAPDGTVHLRGRVLCDEPLLEAPFSGRRCVFHDVVIEPVSRFTMKPALRQVRGLGFRIEDDSGTARVTFEDRGSAPALVAGPRFVNCAIGRDVHERSWPFEQVKPRIEALLSDHGQRQPSRLFGPRLFAAEGVILVGDVVDLVGRGGRRVALTGESSGYRAPPEEYVVEAAEDAPLIVGKVRRGGLLRRHGGVDR